MLKKLLPSLGGLAGLTLLFTGRRNLNTGITNQDQPYYSTAPASHDANKPNLYQLGKQYQKELDLAKYAKDKNIVEMQKIIDTGVNVNAIVDRGFASLHFAVCNPLDKSVLTNHIAAIELLLDNNADIEIESENGYTPFLIAAEGRTKNSTSILKLLAKYEANVFYKTNGITALHSASEAANLQSIDFLIRLGLDVNALDDDGLTPLHWATVKGSSFIMEYFLDGRIDGDAKRLAVVKKLLAAGANPDIKCDNGNTPLDYAKESGFVKVAAYLEKSHKNRLFFSNVSRLDIDTWRIPTISTRKHSYPNRNSQL